ncbi:MAG: serine--tRNA ligase [Candidatus Kerfeldbacteria bacterium]|nr:serine--tRNA ligase [Candidatus Kerfeldbacteria bacterium]
MIDQAQLEGLHRRGRKFRGLLLKLKDQTGRTNKVLRQELELLQAQINAASKLIPAMPADEKKKTIARLKPISDQIATLKAQLANQDEIKLPNIPQPDVPDGEDESANIVEREVGKKPKLKNPKDYLALTEPSALVDLKRGAKVSGSRFGYLTGVLAQMQFALIQYAQSVILNKGFTMVVPPVMVTEDNMAAMGYLAGGGENDVYHLEKDKLYLVGTAEQSIGPMHRDEVFTEAELPKRYLAFSSCFRREAGSYGQDTKGIFRVHQFDKLEMFSFTLPEASDHEHELLLRIQEELMQGLKLPYRVVKLCAGDLGWPSARTWDIETWLPSQGAYRETHSTSTTTDYQSRALNIKVKRSSGEKEHVHLLNGTAFAIGRTLIAILENYQQSDGTVTIPPVLQPFLNGLAAIGR